MIQTGASEEPPAAPLVGPLSVFTLSEIHSMLSSTVQTGELQVVSETVAHRVALDRGELSNAHVGAASTIGQAVFELPCVTDGWFYFTTGLMSSSGQPTVPVATVLIEVRPEVDVWREIREVVPLEAIVTLSPQSAGARRPDPQRPVEGSHHDRQPRPLGQGRSRHDRRRPDRQPPHASGSAQPG
jgi:hypothetical protein